MLVASAGFWSLVMVRQSRHAPNYPAFPLGTYKVRRGAEALLADSDDRAMLCTHSVLPLDLSLAHAPGWCSVSDGKCNVCADTGMNMLLIPYLHPLLCVCAPLM